MKRLLVLTIKTVGWALVLLVLACLLTAVVWEANGIPEWGANAIRAAAADRGISLRADNVRAGLVGGLVLDDAHVRLDRDDIPWVLSAQEVRLRPRLAGLLIGDIQVQEVTFRGASLTLGEAALTQGDAAPAALRLERCSGMAQRRRDGVLTVAVDGLAEKVSVHLEAEVRGLDAVSLRDRAAGKPGVPSAATGGAGAPEPSGRSLKESLARVADLLAAAHLSERDAFLSGHLSLDLRKPREVTFAGEAGLADLVLGDLLVSRFKSRLYCRGSEIRLQAFRLVVGHGETVTGDVRVDLAAGEVSGTVHGQVLPATLGRILPEPRRAWLGRFQAGVPLDITAELLPSPLARERWQVRADVTGRDLQLPGIEVSQFSAAGSWDGQDLTVDRWHAEMEGSGRERIEGRLTWHQAEGTVEGECLARCQPVERARQAGVPALNRALRDVEVPGGATLRVRLERSPLDWRRLRAAASLTADSARVRGRAISPVAIEGDFAEGVLTLGRIGAGFADGPADAVLLSLTTDVSQALSTGTWEVRFDLHSKALAEPVPSPGGGLAPWTEVAALRGAALFTPASGAVDVSAEGTACPGRWYASYMPRLGLPASGIIRDIRCAADAPARVVVTAARAGQRQPLRLLLSVSADGPRYGDLVFRTIQGTIEVLPRQLSFQGVRATTSTGDELALDLRLDTEPLAVTIANARVTGNPDVVHAFIEDRDAKAIYRSVWKDFRWSPEHPAVIDLRSLAYREIAGGRSWELTLDADLRAEMATYKDLPLRSLETTVGLDLPKKVTVRAHRIETDTATLEGSVDILTGSDPKCTFAMRQLAGGQDPSHVLRLLNPAWGAVLGPLTFAPDTAVDCQGSFYLNRDPLLLLSGSLKGAWLQFRGLQVGDPVARWGLSQSEVRWDLTSGKLFGGPVAVTGLYDLEAGRGTVAFRGEGMAMDQVGPHIGMKSEAVGQQGLLSAHCRLDILRGWAGRPLQVYGDGDLSLQEADLWRVPFFDQLGRVLDVTFLNRLTGGKASSLGRITRLDADLGFSGDCVVVRSLATDGTILSLRGHGRYCWETDSIYLAVNGQALDSAGLVGLIFKPLSWAFFNAELTGTSKDSKWRLSTALDKALPGGAGDPGPQAPP